MESRNLVVSTLTATWGYLGQNIAVVRIVGESPYGGWNAVNEITHRRIRIKSAQRLTVRPTPFWVEYMDRMAAKRTEDE